MADRKRATVFGEAAELYEAARPSYPMAAIDLITSHGPADAVDVGCGTGKAARLIADRGIRVTGIEPDERMASVSRRIGIPVVVTSLEAWTPIPCDLMYAAQAWHWVDFDIGAALAARAVRPGGRWAALWNDEDDPIYRCHLDAVYGRLAPQLLEEASSRLTHRELTTSIAASFSATAAFEAMESHEFKWVDQLSVANAVDRLATYSSHRLLAPRVATTLHAALRDELARLGDPITLGYTTYVLLARRLDP